MKKCNKCNSEYWLVFHGSNQRWRCHLWVYDIKSVTILNFFLPVKTTDIYSSQLQDILTFYVLEETCSFFQNLSFHWINVWLDKCRLLLKITYLQSFKFTVVISESYRCTKRQELLFLIEEVLWFHLFATVPVPVWTK